MAQTINLPNYKTINLKAQSRIDKDVSVGDTSLVFENTAEFNAGDTIAIGNTPAGEVTELLTIAAITDATTLTTTAPASLYHQRYEYVNSLLGTTLKVYRAANLTGLAPDDTAFAYLASVPLAADQATSQYTDPNGSEAYWYKFSYFNPTTSLETSLGDVDAVRGAGVGNYCSIEDIRNEAGFNHAPFITDPMIQKKRQAAQDEINATLQGFYDLPFTNPINPFIADICTRLAAGLLLLEQYGSIASMNNNNGTTKLAAARADLQKLAMKQSELTDANGQSIALPGSTGGVSYGVPAAPRFFSMTDLQGYYGRKY